MHPISLDPTRVRPVPHLFLSPTRLPLSLQIQTRALPLFPVRSKANPIRSLSLLNLHKPHVTNFLGKSTEKKTHVRTDTKLYGHYIEHELEAMKEKKREVELNWEFKMKVNGILAAQFLLGTVAYVAGVKYPQINTFMMANKLYVKLSFVLCAFSAIIRLSWDSKPNLLNLTLLGLLSVSLSIPMGLTCANTRGNVVLLSLILTSALWYYLTGYTFWPSKRTGYTFWASKMRKYFSSKENMTDYLTCLHFCLLCASLIFYVVVFVFKDVLSYTVNPLVKVLHNGLYVGTVLHSWIQRSDNIIMLLNGFSHDEYVKASFRLFISFVFLLFCVGN